MIDVLVDNLVGGGAVVRGRRSLGAAQAPRSERRRAGPLRGGAGDPGPHVPGRRRLPEAGAPRRAHRRAPSRWASGRTSSGCARPSTSRAASRSGISAASAARAASGSSPSRRPSTSGRRRRSSAAASASAAARSPRRSSPGCATVAELSARTGAGTICGRAAARGAGAARARRLDAARGRVWIRCRRPPRPSYREPSARPSRARARGGVAADAALLRPARLAAARRPPARMPLAAPSPGERPRRFACPRRARASSRSQPGHAGLATSADRPAGASPRSPSPPPSALLRSRAGSRRPSRSSGHPARHPPTRAPSSRRDTMPPLGPSRCPPSRSLASLGSRCRPRPRRRRARRDPPPRSSPAAGARGRPAPSPSRSRRPCRRRASFRGLHAEVVSGRARAAGRRAATPWSPCARGRWPLAAQALGALLVTATSPACASLHGALGALALVCARLPHRPSRGRAAQPAARHRFPRATALGGAGRGGARRVAATPRARVGAARWHARAPLRPVPAARARSCCTCSARTTSEQHGRAHRPPRGLAPHRRAGRLLRRAASRSPAPTSGRCSPAAPSRGHYLIESACARLPHALPRRLQRGLPALPRGGARGRGGLAPRRASSSTRATPIASPASTRAPA